HDHPIRPSGGWRRHHQWPLSIHYAANGPIHRPARGGNHAGNVRRAAAHPSGLLPGVTFDHVFADLGGVPANRLTDAQGIAGLLLAAANAAGLNPASPPVVALGPQGLSAALVCNGGHVALHGVPDAGLCFAAVAGFLHGIGFPFASIWAVILIAVETLGAACVLLGIFTRAWSILMAIEMLVAIFAVKVPHGGNIELEGLLLAGAITLVALGDGPLSIAVKLKHSSS